MEMLVEIYVEKAVDPDVDLVAALVHALLKKVYSSVPDWTVAQNHGPDQAVAGSAQGTAFSSRANPREGAHAFATIGDHRE